MSRHPLDGAWIKFNAALEHFETLGDDCNTFLDRPYPYSLDMEFDERESCFRLIGHVLREPPLPLSSRIGDVVHNLGSALDNAAFALAGFRAGREVERTSFPIYGDIRLFRAFRRQKKCWMRGLAVEDRTLMERFQPYRGGNFGFDHPMAQLYRLWNQDKHRAIHTTLSFLSEYGLSVTLVKDIDAITGIYARLGPVIDGAEVLRIDVDANGPDPQVKLKSQLEIKVAFEDGLAVRETLAEIGDVVQHILRRIEGFFPTPSGFSRHD